MILFEVDGACVKNVCNVEEAKLCEDRLYKLIMPLNGELTEGIKGFLNSPFQESLNGVIPEISKMDWMIVQLNVGIPRILVFIDKKESLDEIIKEKYISDTLEFIDCSYEKLVINWHCFYTLSQDSYRNTPERLHNSFALVLPEALTHKSENDFYELLTEEKEIQYYQKYVNSLPKLQLVRSFYSEDNGLDLSFQLVKFQQYSDFQYILDASWSQDYSAIYISNFIESDIIGELSDSFNPTSPYEVFNYFSPDIGFKPNFFDATYDLYYLKHGISKLQDLNINSSNIVGYSHPFQSR